MGQVVAKSGVQKVRNQDTKYKIERTSAYLFKIRRALSRNIGDDMAIYHLSVKTGSRISGQSAKAKSDYIEREGKYEKDRDELAYSESGNMPEWAEDNPQKYWEAADEHERANGSLFKEVEFALPVESDERQQRELASSFAADLTGGERLPYTMAIHRGGGDNPHVHLMISERGLDGHARDAEQWFKRANKAAPEKGGALKTRSFMNKEWLGNTRKAWETAANTALERAGRSERIDHRSLAAQRAEAIERGQVDRADELSRQPGVHLGPERYRAERGGPSRVVELAERIDQSNRADREEREQDGPPATDEKAIADKAAEIAGIEARLQEIYDRIRAAIDERVDKLRRAIREGSKATERAGRAVGRAIHTGSEAADRAGRALGRGLESIHPAIREGSETSGRENEGSKAFDRAGRALRRGSEAVRSAVKTGRKTKRAIAGASRGIGLELTALSNEKAPQRDQTVTQEIPLPQIERGYDR